MRGFFAQNPASKENSNGQQEGETQERRRSIRSTEQAQEVAKERAQGVAH
jgi:hypothetical protein